MFGFAGLQVHRYKQRVLTRRARATSTRNVALPAFNDWHLVKVWALGSGGHGGNGIVGSRYAGAGGGGGGGISFGRYQADPLINANFNCVVGSGDGDDTSCKFYDDSIGAIRTVIGRGGNDGTFQAAGGGGGGVGKIVINGGRGGRGLARGGGGGIGGADGQDSTGGANGIAGDGADGNNASGIHAEMQFWGYNICCGGNGGQPAKDAKGAGCGGGGGGAMRTRRLKYPGADGYIGGGGGGGMQGNAGDRPGGHGGRGEVFIVY